MKKTMLFLLVFSIGNAWAGVEKTTETVHFETADYKLNTSEKLKLNSFLAKAAKSNDYEIVISGHTDDVGNSEYNQQLSLNRASEVQQFFVQKGLEKESISLKHYGENNPYTRNTTTTSRSLNRRVDVTFVSYAFDNTDELTRELSEFQTQKFVIDPAKQTLIEGAHGVKILVDANSFVDEFGNKVTEKVEVGLVEALTFKDFVANNLATISDGKLLESGGMLKLEAQTISGKPVKLKGGSPLTVKVPSENRRPNMEVFTSNSGGNWKSTEKLIDQLIEMPVFPIRMLVQKIVPEYEPDLKSKPKMPKKPAKVKQNAREPKEPNKAAYTPTIKWYQVLSKNKIEKKYADRYEDAMEKYDKRLEKFEERHHKQIAAIANYSEKLQQYRKDSINYPLTLEKWEEDEKERYEGFIKTDAYLAAVERYKSAQLKCNEKYNADVSDWRTLKEEKTKEMVAKLNAMNIDVDGSADDLMEAVLANKDKLGIEDKKLMDGYLFSYNNLGWINCDRFYDSQGPKRTVAVADPDQSEEKVYLIFPTINSILALQEKSGGKYLQQNIPLGEKATVFACKVVDGKPMMYSQTITGSNDLTMQFKPCKFRDIRNVLERFNS